MFKTVKPPLGARLIQGRPLANGLAGCWLMNEGRGNTAFDLTESGNNGQLNWTTWEPSKPGITTIYNGTTSYLNCGLGGLLGLNLQASLFIIFKGGPQDNKGLAAKRTTGNDHSIAIRTDNLGSFDELKFIVQNEDDVKTTIVTTSAPLDNTWHSVTGTYDGFNMRLYVDGVQESSSAKTGAIKRTADPFVIGQYSNDGYFAGNIACCYLYGVALSAAEVNSLNSNPYQIFEPDPFGLFCTSEIISGWTGKINGVDSANISKICGIAIANIAKINGV